MIKLTALFEDITVRPARMVIFKIPVSLNINDHTQEYDIDIEYSDGVSIPSYALLPDLNLYAKYPILKFSEVPVIIHEDTSKFDDVRCVCCTPEFSDDPYKGLPDNFSFYAEAYNQTGFCYVSFKSAGNIKLSDVRELVAIEPPTVNIFSTVQDAANYLLFR